MRKLKFVALFLIAVLVLQAVSLVFTQQVAVAKADDLIIEDDGTIILIIGNSNVLAATDPNTPGSKIPVEKKVETIVPPKTETKVEIKASGKDDKKINIKIETKPRAAAQPAATVGKPPAPTAANQPIQTITKTVDTVILRDANKQPVLNIKSDKADQVTIQQKTTTAATSLPVQVDTQTHEVSVTTSEGQKNVSVLPDQAIKGAEDKAVSDKHLPVVQKDVKLIQESGQAVYQVNEVRQGKLFGVLSVSLPTHVKLSAQTGKTTSVWESPITVFLGPFIK